MDASGGEGKIVVFRPSDATWSNTYNDVMMGDEMVVGTPQGQEFFTYHSVYTDGRYFFDPFVSPSPIAQSDYLNMLNEWNPSGVSWRIYTPAPNIGPSVIHLNKGGF